MTSYRTIARAAEDEFTEKRSRFIGAIQPVTTEEEALAFIRARSKSYWDARHNVYAYILEGGSLCRFSDDGEPQGTAGMPVLDVLRKEGLTDCAVVVTRYFGGILLGGGGLVRAYSHAAKLAVDAGGVVTMRPCAAGYITCDYAQYGWVPAIIAQAGGQVTETDFAEAVTVHFTLPEEMVGGLQTSLTDRSAGQLTVEVTDTVMLPFEK
ncbi:MAG: YigZ family protein [Ruminococcaceae bacterium]|nr:YigZ family protein [Oscillospiraceae bacterium]